MRRNYVKSIVIIIGIALLILWFLRSRRNGENSWNGIFLRDIRYVLEPECSAEVVWLINSKGVNSNQRKLIRDSYPSQELRESNLSRIFLLGEQPGFQSKIEAEFSKYKDLVQGSFVDAYRNLTLKHLMGLAWTVTRCANVQHIFKSDDDIVLDVRAILTFITRGTIARDKVAGFAIRRAQPERKDRTNKWFVSSDEFAPQFYPDFVSGWFYILSAAAAECFVEQSERERFFWIDDVFVTGILRERCAITVRPINELFATDFRYLECCVKQQHRRLTCDYIAGPDGGRAELHFEFRRFLDFCRANPCDNRTTDNSVKNTCIAELPAEEPKNGRGEAVKLSV